MRHLATTRAWRRLRVYLIPLLLGAAFYTPGLFAGPFRFDDATYTAIALHAKREGHWWTLLHGVSPYFNKPPLGFWVRALTAGVFGEHGWAIRLPDLLAALGCVALTVSIARKAHGPRVAIAAGCFLALNAHVWWMISSIRLDFLHTFFMLAAVRLAMEATGGTRARRAGFSLLSGASIGLALLVKQLFALYLVPLLAVWMALGGRRGRAALPYLGLVLVAAAAVAAPWHLSMVSIHGDAFADRYFGHQALQRAQDDPFGDEPWYWYLRFWLGGAGRDGPTWLLWPMLACVALAVAWWLAGRRLTTRDRRGAVLAQLYTFGFLVAMCVFSGKRHWYLITVYPGLAWIAGLWVAHVTPRRVRRTAGRVLGPAALAAAVAVAATGARFERNEGRPPDFRALGEFLARHRDEPVFAGNVGRFDASNIYTTCGVWTRYKFYASPLRRDEIPAGSLVVYDADRKPRPDRRDEVVFSHTAPADRPGRPARTFVVVRRAPDGSEKRPARADGSSGRVP